MRGIKVFGKKEANNNVSHHHWASTLCQEINTYSPSHTHLQCFPKLQKVRSDHLHFTEWRPRQMKWYIQYDTARKYSRWDLSPSFTDSCIYIPSTEHYSSHETNMLELCCEDRGRLESSRQPSFYCASQMCFSQIEDKTHPSPAKDYNLLYCDPCFTVIVWTQTHNIFRV